MYTKLNGLSDRIKELEAEKKTLHSKWIARKNQEDYIWWIDQAIKSCKNRMKELQI